MPAYLYRPKTGKIKAHYRYAIIAKNQRIASQYVRSIMRIRDYAFEGKDTRTPGQQWDDISTIAVSVASDWKIPSYIND